MSAAPGTLLLSEVLPAPKDRFSGEWVELYYPGEQPLDLDGWTLDDETDGGGQRLEGLIGPGELIVVELARAIFNNAGDTVRLLGPDGALVDSIAFEAASADLSYSRDLRTGETIADSEPSPLKPYGAGPAELEEAVAPRPERSSAQSPVLPAAEQPAPSSALPSVGEAAVDEAAQAGASSASAGPPSGGYGTMPTYAAGVPAAPYRLVSPTPPAPVHPPMATPAVAPEPAAPLGWPLAAGLGLIVIACGLLVVDRKPL